MKRMIACGEKFLLKSSRVKVKGCQYCPAVCHPRDCSPWDFQARTLEWIPSPGDLPNPGIKLRSPTSQADSLSAEPQGKPES